MYDLLITNARIVDGTGGPSRYGDVAVQNLVAAREIEVVHAPERAINGGGLGGESGGDYGDG